MTHLFEGLERFVRQNVIYPVLRAMLRNTQSAVPLDLKHVSKMLILRYDRIGDMIVTTPILRLLKRANAQMRIDVLASGTNAEILAGNPCVDTVLRYDIGWTSMIRQLVRLRRERYDVVLNLIFNRTTGPALLANVVAPRGFKIGQGPDRYAFYFNRLVKLRRFEQHMLESYVSMIEQAFGISVDRNELNYELTVDTDSRQRVDHWLDEQSLRRKSDPSSQRLPYVVFNPSGKDDDRSLSAHQAAAVAESLSAVRRVRIVVLNAHGKTGKNDVMTMNAGSGQVLFYRTVSVKPLTELASLIEGALLVISPDTSTVHFASAMKTPVFAIYAPVNASQEWLPYNVPYDFVMAEGSQRISDIPVTTIVESARRFVELVSENSGLQSRESE